MVSALEHPVFGQIELAVRSWDFASSEKKKADFTASCLMASTSGGYRVILDVTQDKVSPGERDQLVRNVAEMDGRNCHVFIEQEGGSSGKDVIFHYTKLLKEFHVEGHSPSRDKFVRAQTFSSWVQHGLVKFVRGEWNSRFFNELKSFPNGEHDDMVDASSSAFNRLATVDTWTLQGTLIAGGPTQIKPMTPKQVEEMSEGPLKNILKAAANRPIQYR